MDSTPKPKTTEPNDAVVALADERLAHAYGQIARADEQLARVNEQLSKLEHDAPRHPWAVPGRRTSRFRPGLRGLIGLLLAACIFVAAFVSQSSYGGAAKLIIGRWAPQLALTSSLPPEKPAPPTQPNSPAVQAAVAESAPAQPTPSAQVAPQEGPPTVTTVSPELTQLLQTMARDLAHVEQVVDQLSASQAQMASDNARAVEQLKASQEQMMRLIARASDARSSEQKPQPRTSASPPQLTGAPTRKPVPTPQSSQARAHPQAPTQLQPKQQ
jgi:uncharacterized coiled-coil protein SlyX